MTKTLFFLLLVLSTATGYLLSDLHARYTGQNCVVNAKLVAEYLYAEDKTFEIAETCKDFGKNCVEELQKWSDYTNLVLQALKQDLSACFTPVTTEKKAHFLHISTDC